MRIRVRLTPEDQKRYECPEWMELDPFSLTATEAFVLQAGFTREGVTMGFDSPAAWREALNKGTAAAGIVLVWLALRRSDVSVSLADLEFDYDNAGWKIVPDAAEPDQESGKGEESDPATT